MKCATYLFSSWGKIEQALAGKDICLFLDYDGTVAPIVRTPGIARIPRKTKNLLRQLAGTTQCAIAIISGRTRADIVRRVGLKNIVYAGSHGCEIRGPRIRFTCRIQPRYWAALKQLKEVLNERLSSIPGVLIEDKHFSLSVHYRCVGKKDIRKVKDIFYVATALPQAKNKVRVHTGKMLLEIRPPIDWDKGAAVLWLLKHQRSMVARSGRSILPIYIGDDVTDEDAFKALRQEGITAVVGKVKKTAARYYLRNVAEVARLLRLLLKRQA